MIPRQRGLRGDVYIWQHDMAGSPVEDAHLGLYIRGVDAEIVPYLTFSFAEIYDQIWDEDTCSLKPTDEMIEN